MSTSSPRPPMRVSAASGDVSTSHRTTPQRTGQSPEPPSSQPTRTAAATTTTTASGSGTAPMRLPPLQSSRSHVPLDGLVAAHAAARTRAQPVTAPPAPSASHSGTAEMREEMRLDVWQMLARHEDERSGADDAPLPSSSRAHEADRSMLSPSMSPSMADTAGDGTMPPSPAYTAAPGSPAYRSVYSPEARAGLSRSPPPPLADSPPPRPQDAPAATVKRVPGGASKSNASSLPRTVVALSARRPGEASGRVPRSEPRARAEAKSGAATGPRRAHAATARSAGATRADLSNTEDDVQSASLAAAVRKATRAWLQQDEAAPLAPHRHRLAPTAVTVQDELLTESGGGGAGGFTHILDMAGTTARTYWPSGALTPQDRDSEDDEADEAEPFAMTAPASLLLLTTDSGARYGNTIHSLADLELGSSTTGRAGAGNASTSLANTATPPPSRGVYVTPGSPALLDKTLLSTQPAPPRWAGTLTSDRQRDHPRPRDARNSSNNNSNSASVSNGGARLPPIDATASELAALTTRSRRALGLTDTWASTVREAERDGAQSSLALARALFYYVIRGHPSHHLFVDSGAGQMTALASHVAVSSLLLDQLVVSLPRHHAVLIPYVQLLLRHVYVPDTPGVREALGGTVMDEAVLAGLLTECESYRAQCARHGSDSSSIGAGDSVDLFNTGTGIGGGDIGAPYSGRGVSMVARASETQLGQTSPEALVAMLLPYARKTFFLAHLELSQRVVGMAHLVRCRQTHFQRLPLVIDRMQASWSKGLLRTVMRLWSRVCHDRRLQERKLRQRWARRWAAERLSTGIRRWREYASDVLKSAEATAMMRHRISETKGAIERLNANVEGMRRKTHELNKALLANEVERQQMTLESAATEQTYKEVLERVREMDRVGTSLLEELLLAEPLPDKAELLSLASSAPSMDLHKDGAAAAASSCASVAAAAARLRQPLAYLGSLQVMATWANHLMTHKGKDTELLCLQPPSPEEASMIGSPSSPGGRSESALIASATPQPKYRHQQQQPFDEAELRVQLAGTFDSLLDPVAAYTRIPLYKYLVLMRAFGEDDLNVPTLAVTRLVKAVDEQVHEAWLKLDALDTTTAPSSPTGGAKAGAAAARPVGAGKPGAALSPMERLPEAVKEAAEKVTSILVDCYQQLTGTACVATAELLFLRRRPTWLVFLAGLFRHYTNWIIRKGQSDMANLQAEMEAVDAALETETGGDGSPRGTAVAKVDDKRHLGRRHPQNDAWYYPPQQHHRWPVLVQQQQTWIAESLNALHGAVEEARRVETLPTMEEQESWGQTLQCIPVTALADLLPAQPSLSSDIYVNVLRVVERYFSRLRMVFDLYAIPYRDVIEARRLCQRKKHEARLRELRRLGASVEELAAMRRELEAEDGDAHAFLAEPMSVMPAYAFWSILCVAGLAGAVAERNALNPLSQCPQPAVEAFTTLHRPAVFSLIEYVTQRHAGDGAAGELAAGGTPTSAALSPSRRPSLASGLRRGSHRRSASSPSQGSPPSPSLASDAATAEVARRRGRAVCYLGETTGVLRTGGYARAVREGRHVDLRDDRGVLCLTLPQFLEAMVRCVHAWVALNHEPAKPPAPHGGLTDNPPTDKGKDGGGGGGGGGGIARRGSLMRPSTSASVRGSFAGDVGSGDFSPFSRPSRQDSMASVAVPGGGESTATTPRPQAHHGHHRRSGRPRVSYEPYVDDHESVQPATVALVVRDFLLPRLLGARSMATTPFELACRCGALARFFALHHEALYKVFDQFSEPVEATGMVRALPPPLCHWVSETTTATTTNMMSGTFHASQTSAATAADERAASASRPSTARRQSSASRRSSATGASRDVGIVSVLTAESALAMAKALQWADGGGAARRRRVTPAALHHCLVSVVADYQREGEVLFLSEFPLFLCAVSQFVDPSPRTPLDAKVQAFVQEKVLNAADEDEEEDEDEDSGRAVDTLVIE